ncbi:MAG: Gfo/Idh/MocA family oxidoreductase [Phycisphaeraceae bacterium]|nr:Gfo/Idh/MocA family oxidoreductase [Phycisphaeraceae bacterium]
MPLTIAILGFAHGHIGMYADQWLRWPDEVRLIAGWDHDAARLRTNADKFNLSATESVDAILSRSDLDAVVIGAETSMHADLCEKAAAAGKAIVLQKPMALTLAEAERIIAAVNKAGVKFTIAWQMRVDPQNLKMKNLIAEGVLGRVYQVRRRHCLSTHQWPGFENSWHTSRQLNRGMWADDAAHPIDWMLWMFGEPASVIAEIDTLHNPKVPDDNGVAIFRYPNGLQAEVSCSFTATASENTTEIVGEKGTIIQNYGDAVSCNLPRAADAIGLKWITNAGKEWTDSLIPSPAGHAARIADLARPILDFLRGLRDPIATAREGCTALRMVLASYQAAQLGRRVLLSEIK